ncbi:MAG: hypothetical protein ACI3XQ_03300 [Eubacteriales bacterium]
MKSKFRKILSFAMVTVFVVFTLCSFSAGAEDVTDPLDANLVIHHDFEGIDILEAIKDKAPAGKVADDVSPVAGGINFSGLTVDNVNGTLTQTASGSGVVCLPSDDTKTVTGASTWFVRAKLQNLDSNQYFFIVEMRTFGSASIRPFAIQYDKNSKELCVCISEASTPNKAQNFRFAYDYDYSSGKYINIAVVVDQALVEENTVYQATLYVSTDLAKNAEDWTALGTKTIGAGIAAPTDANKLYYASNGSNGCANGVTIDDVRLYNKALTLDEIATIIPNGSFDGQLKERPSDTDTDTSSSEQDTEAPATEDTASKTETEKETQAESNSGAATTASDKKSVGCGSSVSAGALVAVTVLSGAAVVIGKKHRVD